MNGKEIFETLKKNRYLIISSAILIFGIVFGTVVIKYLPAQLCESIFSIASKKTENFYVGFIDKFTLPFVIITALYLSGFSAAGQITSGGIIFIYGLIYGVKNAINYSFIGSDFLTSALLEYFTFTIYTVFLMLIMSENTFVSARKVSLNLKPDLKEKPYYNAKKITVKYVTFTAIFAVFSVFSAFISGIF